MKAFKGGLIEYTLAGEDKNYIQDIQATTDDRNVSLNPKFQIIRYSTHSENDM